MFDKLLELVSKCTELRLKDNVGSRTNPASLPHIQNTVLALPPNPTPIPSATISEGGLVHAQAGDNHASCVTSQALGLGSLPPTLPVASSAYQQGVNLQQLPLGVSSGVSTLTSASVAPLGPAFSMPSSIYQHPVQTSVIQPQQLPPHSGNFVSHPMQGNFTQGLVPQFQNSILPSTQGPFAPPPQLQVPSHQQSFLAASVLPPLGLSSTPVGHFKMERPLLVFDGTKGPEEFEKFIRTFQFYIGSRGMQQYAMNIVETWLEKTPLLVYQQFLRDYPGGTFDQFKLELLRNFGNSLDPVRAVHKLHLVQWRHGQNLVELATEIRDLHFSAHPTAPMEQREVYAGDTFIRCLPEVWQVKLREKRLTTLTQYLESALELEMLDKYRAELRNPGKGATGISSRKVDAVKSEFGMVWHPLGSQQEEKSSGTKEGKRFQPRCYFCKKKGHERPSCEKFLKWCAKKGIDPNNLKRPNQSKPNSELQAGSRRIEGGSDTSNNIAQSDIVQFCKQSVKVVAGKVSSLYAGMQIFCPVDIEGHRVQALCDTGADINIVSSKALKEIIGEEGAKYHDRFRAVDKKFSSYSREELKYLKVWLPLLVEVEGQ